MSMAEGLIYGCRWLGDVRVARSYMAGLVHRVREKRHARLNDECDRNSETPYIYTNSIFIPIEEGHYDSHHVG